MQENKHFLKGIYKFDRNQCSGFTLSYVCQLAMEHWTFGNGLQWQCKHWITCNINGKVQVKVWNWRCCEPHLQHIPPSFFQVISLRKVHQPKKYKHRFPVVNTIDLWVEVEVWFNGVQQARWHSVNLVKDEQWSRTHSHIASNPVSQLVLKIVNQALIRYIIVSVVGFPSKK